MIDRVPPGVTFSTMLLLASAMYTLPSGAAYTSAGDSMYEPVAGPGTGLPPPPGTPAKSVMIAPDGGPAIAGVAPRSAVARDAAASAPPNLAAAFPALDAMRDLPSVARLPLSTVIGGFRSDSWVADRGPNAVNC